MGRRGPKKKLAALEILDGNPSKKLIALSGLEALGEPFAPEHLMDDARGCVEVIRESMPPGVYARLDSFLLAAYGMAWAVHKRASHEIASPTFDWMVENGQGSMAVSPWIKTMNTQAQLLATLGDRLGLDPKSRAGLKVPGMGHQKSKFDGLIITQSSAEHDFEEANTNVER